jgi:hypothetical protein
MKIEIKLLENRHKKNLRMIGGFEIFISKQTTF